MLNIKASARAWLVASVAFAAMFSPGAADAQFRRWGSYQACSDYSCEMCWRDTPHYRPRGGVVVTRQVDVAPPKPKTAKQSPSPIEAVEAMVDLIDWRPGDIVCDPGCGDGRILKRAWETHNVPGLGIEIVPEIAREARENCRGLGVTIQTADSTLVDLSGATVYLLYLTPELTEKLAPRLNHARRIVSFRHPIPGYECSRIVVGPHTFFVTTGESATQASGMDPGDGLALRQSRWRPRGEH